MNSGLLGTPIGHGDFARCAEIGPLPFALSTPVIVGNPFGRNALVFARLRCFTADRGYLPGDEYISTRCTGGGSSWFSVYLGRNTAQILVSNAVDNLTKTAGVRAAITASRWRLYLTLVG